MTVKFKRGFFADLPILPECRVSIVVPVRDETDTVEKSLASFARQTDFDGKLVDFNSFEILVLANNCTDDSAEIVRKFKRENPKLNLHLTEINLRVKDANIGFARRVLMDEAFQRLQQNRFSGGVIMTTDGDTTVADDWVAANLREIRMGADAVGGRILISDPELEMMDARCRETHLKDEEYRLLTAEIESLIDDLPFDNSPRHHQHFNASFACATSIYEKAGGVPKVKFLEDCAFFDVLQKLDARVRHSPFVRVYTSSRHVGRCEVGLSFQLNLWKNLRETGKEFLVESAESVVERFATKRLLRKIRRDLVENKKINQQEIQSVAERICVSAKFIETELIKQKTFGAFYENLSREQRRVGKWARRFPAVTLDAALNGLKIESRKYQARKSANSGC